MVAVTLLLPSAAIIHHGRWSCVYVYYGANMSIFCAVMLYEQPLSEKSRKIPHHDHEVVIAAVNRLT